MIPVQDAAKNQFAASTEQELDEYAAELGVTFHHRHKTDTKRKLLLEQMGLATNLPSESPASSVFKIKTKDSDILPGYNLTPNGIWEGRRHRIVLRRPEGAPQADKALPVGWNGKAAVLVKYNEVCNVPEPVFNRLRELTRPIPRSVTNSKGEITTEFDHEPRYAMDYRGVDPETKDRFGSLSDFYKSKGPKWFRSLNSRQMVTICQLCDVKYKDRDNKNLPDADLLAGLLTFVYGYADADTDDPVPEREAA